VPDWLAGCIGGWFRSTCLYGFAAGGPVILAECLLCMESGRAQGDIKFCECDGSDGCLVSGNLGCHPVVILCQSIVMYPQAHDRGQEKGSAQK
jgi:hypothetical protein